MVTLRIDHTGMLDDPVGAPTQPAAASWGTNPQNHTLTLPCVVPVLPAAGRPMDSRAPVRPWYGPSMTPARIAVTPSAIFGSSTCPQRIGGTLSLAFERRSTIDTMARVSQCLPCAANDAYASAMFSGAISFVPSVIDGTC